MSLLFSDNFDDNDVTDWTSGGGTVTASSEKAQVALGTHWRYKATGLSGYSSMWTSFKATLLSSGLTWASGGYCTAVTGPGVIYGNITLMSVGFCNVSGTRYLRTYWEQDPWPSGSQSDRTSFPIALDTEYTFTMFIQEAASTSSNDGILRWWVDGGGYSHELVHEITTADNNAGGTLAERFYLGHSLADTTGTVTIDDLKMGTTEADVYTSTARNSVPMGFVLE